MTADVVQEAEKVIRRANLRDVLMVLLFLVGLVVGSLVALWVFS